MSEPRWVLELMGGDSKTVELPLTGTLVIGSSRERAGFVVEGQGVEDAHCAVGRTKEGDWAVKDLGSRYGTLLNGQKVAAARLKLGDQIVLGSRRLEVRDARAEAARAAVQAVGSARPADAPQRIGGYRIERLIGKGGMGAVYLAVQESLRRPVALKVLAPKLAADRDFVHRFQAEARAAAALSHPNVVVVYDVGEEGGSHYLSMEFMAGGSLEQKLAASGPVPWKTLLGILTDAAGGLAYAESRGIVHRDIKPANLMYSGTGTVKIADLGLATTLEQEANEAGDGRKVYGTPHFISPEQARGEAVDHRSDLYSLGATAYRLLSGHTPFEGASTREILRALQTEEPRPLRELVTDLPPELDALITRLMAKEPAARFPTAEALRRECERLRLVAEHGPTLATRSGSRVQRAVGVALLLVVVGASAAWYVLGGSKPVVDPLAGSARLDEDAPGRTSDDSAFFGDTPGAASTGDEEQVLREREREASAALRELAPFLSAEERRAALEGLCERYPGTAAARAARAELDALLAQPAGATPGGKPITVETALEELRAVVEGPDAEGERRPLAGALAIVEGYRPPPEIAAEFEGGRAAYAAELVQHAEGAIRERCAQATRLALEGKFDEERALLADTQALFAGLDGIPGDPARLAGMRALRDEVAGRIERVPEEERFWYENLERARRSAVGAALGPTSGVLAEIEALDFGALERRLAALAPELRERPLCATLAREVPLARGALEALRTEFVGGGWRRKALVDPRTKKVREVRDVRAEALVFDREGALDTMPWRDAKCDPEWWHQLFQARLAREWSSAEARGIAALLRLVGAARAADLAREMLDGGGRQLLQPGELEALGKTFDPPLAWLEGTDAALADARAELERERAAAGRLAQALEAAQGHSWTSAVAHLERLLGEQADTLVVGLLSDGGDWRGEPRPAPPANPAPAGKDAEGGK